MKDVALKAMLDSDMMKVVEDVPALVANISDFQAKIADLPHDQAAYVESKFSSLRSAKTQQVLAQALKHLSSIS